MSKQKGDLRNQRDSVKHRRTEARAPTRNKAPTEPIPVKEHCSKPHGGLRGFWDPAGSRASDLESSSGSDHAQQVPELLIFKEFTVFLFNSRWMICVYHSMAASTRPAVTEGGQYAKAYTDTRYLLLDSVAIQAKGGNEKKQSGVACDCAGRKLCGGVLGLVSGPDV
jgi:hypothetical protein